ncbi:MAG TPA: ABC transporter substrate-binding protein, partial [Mycobacteriales bacterium]|nr:ABC transporter substrate-binding protein [Mycobacteriales bacterium]
RAAVIAAAGGGPVTMSSGQAVTPDASGASTAAAPGATVPTGTTTGGTAGGGPTVGGTGPGTTTGGGTATTGGGTTATTAPTTGTTTSSAPALGGTRSSAAPQAAEKSCTKQGSTIVFGQVGTFSGIIGAAIGAGQPGLKVWASATNAAGGIACHPVQVVSIDDGGDAGKAQSAVQQMVEQDHAVAINALVPVTLNGVEPYVDAHHIPVVGGDLVAKQWNTDQYLFPQGPSLEPVLYTFMRYAAMNGGTKYSFLYCIEATPCTAAQDLITKQGLGAKAGLQSVGDQPISLAGSNFTQQCQTAKSKGADVLIVGAGATALTAIARDCSNQGYHPRIITESLAAVTSLQSNPQLDGLAIGNTQFPWTDALTPAQQAFAAAMAKYAPSVDNSGSAAAAWTSGELLKKAILNLGQAAYGDITSADVLKGLGMVKNETLGGLAPGKITFNPGAPASLNRCGFVSVIANGKWTDPLHGQQICEP